MPGALNGPADGSSPANSNAPKKTLISYFTRRTAAPAPAATGGDGNNNPNPPQGSAGGRGGNYEYDVSNTPPPPAPPVRRGNNDDARSVVSESAMTDAGVEASASEVNIGPYLGVSVVRGRLVAKKMGEAKTHPSYEVNRVECVWSVCECVSVKSNCFLCLVLIFEMNICVEISI